VPISLVTTQANLLDVHPSVPVNTLQEFIALLKANPGKYAFGSTGTGTSNHVATELFMMRTGTKMLHVPYKGSGPMIPALLGGEVSLAFDNMPTSLPQVQAGKLKALGVTSPTRMPELPNVPAMVELIPEFTVQSWQGLFAPAGTPQHIVDLLAEQVQAVLRLPEVVERIKGMGAQTGTIAGPQFTAFVRGETERWAEVVKASGAKAE
jgi:tripartite-type tricarboxylate transporter receptor subunit TctC